MQTLKAEELMYWKSSPITRAILQALKDEIDKVKENLANGFLLTFDQSEHLSREYAKLTGYIDGLNFIGNFIEDTKEEAIEEKERGEIE